jgi:hypothetical protein
MTTTSLYEQAVAANAPYYLSDTRPATSYAPAHIYVMRRFSGTPENYAASNLYAYRWNCADPWQIHHGDHIYGQFNEQDARTELERVAFERFV